ncbi:MAG: hypothetical protein JNL82_02450 [Myxococcales bacterium]|nr:hypothetical protein [Myxococcales bacterium]
MQESARTVTCWALAAALAACGGGAGERGAPASPTPPPSDRGPEPEPAPVVEDPPASPAAAATPAKPLPGPADAGTCPERDDPGFGILVAPVRPAVGERVRILAATLDGEEAIALRIDPGPKLREVESPVPADMSITPGVPSSAIASLTPQAAGEFTVVVGRGGVGKACLKLKVRAQATSEAPPPAPANQAWPSVRAWDAGEEALYSAWLRALFHAELGADLAYTALDQVTTDAERNLLHGSLGWREDDRHPTGLKMAPDCADTPYFLRAYYAWKRGLPFAFRACSRGLPGKPPKCGESVANTAGQDGTGPQPGQLGAVQYYMRRTLAWGVHTGNGRVGMTDERSDLYPVRLDRRSLRPGTVYADPYGHILVLVELFEGTGGRPGVLYAIDGQPDASITRKRFWEGNFLWNPDPGLGGSGFKNFRPVVVREGVAAQMTDAEILKAPGYGDVSPAQAELNAAQFYDAMELIVTPGRRDPLITQEEVVAALFEQARVRVTSVANGEEFFRKNPGATVPMPDGFKVFETTGAWESYSTPARDLRLLIAIDVVRGFAEKIKRQPEVFGVPAGDAAALAAVTARLAEARDVLLRDPRFSFEYTRSDGSKWKISLADLIARADRLEAAYNPNDCPELRWGAEPGSEEARTCRRHAPPEQQDKMQRYKTWFHERKRPARGT